MKIDSEVTLNAKTETLGLPEFKGFAETLKHTFSSFADRAPSDSAFQVDVKTTSDGGYKIAINLASDALSFCEEAVGKSPFAALDRAIVKARRKLDLWSTQKNMSYH